MTNGERYEVEQKIAAAEARVLARVAEALRSSYHLSEIADLLSPPAPKKVELPDMESAIRCLGEYGDWPHKDSLNGIAWKQLARLLSEGKARIEVNQE